MARSPSSLSRDAFLAGARRLDTTVEHCSMYEDDVVNVEVRERYVNTV
jgi:hypothetical protein